MIRRAGQRTTEIDRRGFLRGALAYLECHLRHAQEAGDHTIFIAEVEDVQTRAGEPLLYFHGKYNALGKEL